jgi:predicted ATP-dependent protease
MKGSFTGAEGSQEGLFQRARGGTIFLDEIGEMPLSLQPKLLRVLEEKTVLPVSSTTPVKVDVRVLAASNRDLKSEVEAGRFREDLYYRIMFSRSTSRRHEDPHSGTVNAFVIDFHLQVVALNEMFHQARQIIESFAQRRDVDLENIMR